ncbi:hypothetical protein [Pseudomonas purpurea]|uniref:hypothetical protein n=1 Tax=Pseudomonas purpurea TaxID=3136737 RepID=UPI003267B170
MSSVLHNKKLRQLFEQSNADVEAAASPSDLLDVIRRIEAFGGPLEFDNATPKLFRNIGFALIAATVFFIPLLLFGLGFLLGSWLVMDNRSGLVDALSKTIAQKSAMFTHGLNERFNPDVSVLESLRAEFKEFHRGSYSRQLMKTVQGTYLGALHELPFTYQHFQYVDRETRETKVPDGAGGTKVETKTIDSKYARHSLVLNFPWIANVRVRGDRFGALDLEETLDTTSSEFNRAFHLTGKTQMACALFAKPATVLHMMQLTEQLSDVNLEFSGQGRLCLSFSDTGVLEAEASQGLKNLQGFNRLIETGIRFPRLDLLLLWVHRLAELHDDNFAPSAKTVKNMEY